MAASTTAHLRTAILEALTTVTGKPRALASQYLFQAGYPPGVDPTLRSTRALEKPGAFVAIGRVEPQAGVTTEIGSDRLYLLQIAISRDYHIGYEFSLADVQTWMSRVADDFMRVRDALCYPGNLTQTAGAIQTGIADNGLDASHAFTTVRFERIGEGRDRLLNAIDVFHCHFLHSDQVSAPVPPPNPLAISSTAHYWTFSDGVSVEIDNDVNALLDSKGHDALFQTTSEGSKPDFVVSSPTLGNQPAARFPVAGDNFLQSFATMGTVVPQPCIAWAVCSKSANDANNTIIGGVTTRWFLRFNGTSQIELYAGGTGAVAAFTSAIGVRYGIVAVLNGPSSQIWVNGVQIYAGATNIGSNSITDFMIGREAFSPFAGDVAEAGACSGASGADVAALNAWMMSGRFG